MTAAIETAGDFATGTMLGRAVEPRTGEPVAGRHDRHGGGGRCLNCGTTLIGDFCHACGQSANVHRTIASIGHDLLHGVFHFEGKIWRTVPMLALHPGQLTRRYIAGERARFVSPLAMFLFSVFAMFAVYNAVGPQDTGKMIASAFDNTQAAIGTTHDRVIAKQTELEQARAALLTAGKPTQPIDAQIAEHRTSIAAIGVAEQRFGRDKIYTGMPWLDHALNATRENPELVAYKVQSGAYKYSWMLIILSTPFVALLFLWKRGYKMYDHVVFVTYSITFMTILAIVGAVAGMIEIMGGLLGTLLLLVAPVHMFAQLRGAYRLGVFSALWRTMALTVFASIALCTFVFGIIALEVTG